MRGLLYVASVLGVMALAFWAYRENYNTQAAQRGANDLKREIAALHQAIRVQRAEWAYLNRPERLQELADLNFERLGLLPLDPAQFGEVVTIPYPAPPAAEPPSPAPPEGETP